MKSYAAFGLFRTALKLPLSKIIRSADKRNLQVLQRRSVGEGLIVKRCSRGAHFEKGLNVLSLYLTTYFCYFSFLLTVIVENHRHNFRVIFWNLHEIETVRSLIQSGWTNLKHKYGRKMRSNVQQAALERNLCYFESSEWKILLLVISFHTVET